MYCNTSSWFRLVWLFADTRICSSCSPSDRKKAFSLTHFDFSSTDNSDEDKTWSRASFWRSPNMVQSERPLWITSWSLSNRSSWITATKLLERVFLNFWKNELVFFSEIFLSSCIFIYPISKSMSSACCEHTRIKDCIERLNKLIFYISETFIFSSISLITSYYLSAINKFDKRFENIFYCESSSLS